MLPYKQCHQILMTYNFIARRPKVIVHTQWSESLFRLPNFIYVSWLSVSRWWYVCPLGAFLLKGMFEQYQTASKTTRCLPLRFGDLLEHGSQQIAISQFWAVPVHMVGFHIVRLSCRRMPHSLRYAMISMKSTTCHQLWFGSYLLLYSISVRPSKG